jgi:hypothetical protein
MIVPTIRRPNICGTLLAAMLVGLATAVPVQAQEFGRIQETETNASYFFYAQPGEATIQVAVWGVPQPGLYEVPDSTDLDRLLSLAGGIPMQARREGRKPPRITVRLYRPEQSRQDPLLEARVQDLLQGEVGAPQLRENDVIVVETVQPDPFTWRDALSVVSTAASLVLLGLRIFRLSD